MGDAPEDPGVRPTGSVLKRAGALVSGTAGGQLLVIGSSPFLTRLFAPEDFGVLGVYAAVVTVVALVGSLRFELAIPLPESEERAASLLLLSLLVAVITTGFVVLGTALLGGHIVRWAGIPSFAPYIWLIPVGVLIGAWNKAFMFWALRQGALRRLGLIRIQQAGGMVGVQCALGGLGWGPLGLLLGHIVGVGAGMAGLMRAAARSRISLARGRSLATMRSVAAEYRNFPLFSTWSDLANVSGTQLPLVLFAGLFSPAVAGLYMMAQRVANAPVAFVSEAVGKAFLVSAVAARQEGHLRDLSLEVFGLLVRICLGPMVILAFIAPELFGVVFGSQWAGSGQYLRWIIPWTTSVFVFVPMMTLYVALEKQKNEFVFQLTLLVARVGGLLLGAFLGGPTVAVALFSLAAASVYCGFGFTLLRISGVRAASVASKLWAELKFVIPMALVLAAAKSVLDTDEPTLTARDTQVLAALAAGLVGVALLRVKPALRSVARLVDQS